MKLVDVILLFELEGYNSTSIVAYGDTSKITLGEAKNPLKDSYPCFSWCDGANKVLTIHAKYFNDDFISERPVRQCFEDRSDDRCS